jgi:hypothetical protein
MAIEARVRSGQTIRKSIAQRGPLYLWQMLALICQDSGDRYEVLSL